MSLSDDTTQSTYVSAQNVMFGGIGDDSDILDQPEKEQQSNVPDKPDSEPVLEHNEDYDPTTESGNSIQSTLAQANAGGNNIHSLYGGLSHIGSRVHDVPADMMNNFVQSKVPHIDHHDIQIDDMIRKGLNGPTIRPEVKDKIEKLITQKVRGAKTEEQAKKADDVNKKYSWVYGHKEMHHSEYPDDNIVNLKNKGIPEEHILKHTRNYDFVSGNLLEHKVTGSKHLMDDSGKLTRVRGGPHENTYVSNFTKPISSGNFHHANIPEHLELGHHITYQAQPKEVQRSLKNYTGEHSKIFNQFLVDTHRGKVVTGEHQSNPYADPMTTEDVKGHISNIKKAIDETHPLKEGVDVFTGISRKANPRHGEESSKGRLVSHFPAFTSTSLSPSVAVSFASSKGARKDNRIQQDVHDVIHIHLPKGSKHGFYIGHHSPSIEEDEMILKPGINIEHDSQPTYFTHNRDLIRVWKNGKVVE